MDDKEQVDLRDSYWWLKAYYFLLNFKGYKLEHGSFLEGMFIHICLKDHTGKWMGPELIVHKGITEISNKRLLT